VSNLTKVEAGQFLTNDRYNKYKVYGVTAADLIQFGANHATVSCPLGPRVRTFVGRFDSDQLPPPGLLPDVEGSADSILALFEAKTIRPHGLTALLGAHTTSQQRFFNTARALDPQDSTPGVWDTLFYNQTVNPNSPPRVLKFPADVKLAAHPRVQSEWQAFMDPKIGQAHWDDVSLIESLWIPLTCQVVRKGIRQVELAWCLQH
jgi:hypothetical protein